MSWSIAEKRHFFLKIRSNLRLDPSKTKNRYRKKTLTPVKAEYVPHNEKTDREEEIFALNGKRITEEKIM